MNKQPDEQVYIKDDSSLFDLVAQLTEELPPQPQPTQEIELKQAIPIQIDLPFSVLVGAVDQLPLPQATLLHHRLEKRLSKAVLLAA